MVKITSKLYRPADLLDVIKAVETILAAHKTITPADLVLDLRKAGYKIVKVDNGIDINK